MLLPEHRKLAAVMFTDIVGYTALMSKDEQKALSLLQKNREMQKTLAEKHNGEFLKEMGDGTLLCFQSALNGVQCAMEIQESVKDDPDLNIRIGIHLGDIVFREGDIFGDGVNVASRIERLAGDGDIYLSENVYQLIKNQSEINTEFIGEKNLKHVDHPVKIYKLSVKGAKSSQPGVYIQKESDSKEKSIIVLPFENMSPDPDQEYFSDGLTEEVITDLSYIHDLLVISRNSAMTFKGTKKKTKEIAGEVNVRYILEGSVRKAGNNLRIVAQLIDAETDTHLWAEKYSGTLEDVFDIQEKVSRSIVDALKVKLGPEENQRLGTRAIDNGRAYECFLKARHDIYQLSEEFLDSGLDLVEQGLKIVGDNDLLYALKCIVYLQYVNTLSKPPEIYEDLLKKGRQAAKKALSINPNSAFAHFSQGTILHQSGNPKGAIQHWKRAVELDSNHSDALGMLGYQLIAGGRDPDRARGLIEKGIKLDPLTPMASSFIGWFHIFNGNFHQALRSMDLWFQALKKINSPYQFMSAWIYAAAGDTDKSFRIIDKIVHNMPEHLISTLMIFLKRALLGEKQKALAALTEQLKQAAWCDDFFSLMMTDAYALIDEKDNAFHWLEHTINYGYTNVGFLEEFEPFLENIRSDKRFPALMQKAKSLSESLEEEP